MTRKSGEFDERASSRTVVQILNQWGDCGDKMKSETLFFGPSFMRGAIISRGTLEVFARRFDRL